MPSSKSDPTVADKSIEISVRGKWKTVPALNVDGKFIIVRGGWTKLAVIESEEWLEHEVEDPEVCVKKIKGHPQRLHADIFTFGQKVPGSPPKYTYTKELDSVAALHLTSFNNWWEKLPQESRKNVRRSQKRGVVVKIRELDDDLIRGIIGVNNDSPVRQGMRYVHYGKTFNQVKKDQSSFLDRSSFICAYFEEELIGFMKIIYSGEVASILQMLPKASHQDKRPANALLAKAVELCEERGISYLRYGLFNYGNKHASSLRDFKSRNGFEEMLTPRFYIPLTMWGSVSLRLNLHLGLLGTLPPSVIDRAVRARAMWYKASSRLAGVAQRQSVRSVIDRWSVQILPPAPTSKSRQPTAADNE